MAAAIIGLVGCSATGSPTSGGSVPVTSHRAPGGVTVLDGDLSGLEVFPAALSPDGRRLAAVVETVAGRVQTPGSGYGVAPSVTPGPAQLWVWDVRTGRRLTAASIPYPATMTFARDGSRVITEDPHDRGGELHAFDIATGAETALYVTRSGNPDGTDGGGPQGNTPETRHMFALGPDGSQLATFAGNGFAVNPPGDDGGLGRTVTLRDAVAGAIIRPLQWIPDSRVEFPPAFTYSPHGEAIVAGYTRPRPSADTTDRYSAGVARWSTSTGALLERLDIDPGPGTSTSTISRMVARVDRTGVATGVTVRPPSGSGEVGRGQTLWMFDTSTRRRTTLADSIDRGYATDYDTDISPDGTQIAVLTTKWHEAPDHMSARQTYTITTFDVSNGRRLHERSLPATPCGAAPQGVSRPAVGTRTIQYSPDGSTFMVAGCGLTLYDSKDPQTERALQTATDARRCDLGTTAQFSDDSTRIVGSGPCGIRVYDTSNGDIVARAG
ncbi:hypothetical protein GPOL_c34650 [Gordonia polyisoprenivorans VH2]|uniref:Uncharacterized protein n=2 Tax=Gordonia polyisoprenivorans TaxID=84595 RepID=H6N025_GORPV|nr:hypothetical protein GPOL_c34650 [Gordonia polyisoprenivorans VH2]